MENVNLNANNNVEILNNPIKSEKVIVLSTTAMSDKKYEILGIVSGNRVVARNAISDFGAELKSIVGGRLKTYEKMLRETREMAIEELKYHARLLDADAVVSIKQSTSEIAKQSAEICVFGTAVKFIKN